MGPLCPIRNVKKKAYTRVYYINASSWWRWKNIIGVFIATLPVLNIEQKTWITDRTTKLDKRWQYSAKTSQIIWFLLQHTLASSLSLLFHWPTFIEKADHFLSGLACLKPGCRHRDNRSYFNVRGTKLRAHKEHRLATITPDTDNPNDRAPCPTNMPIT